MQGPRQGQENLCMEENRKSCRLLFILRVLELCLQPTAEWRQEEAKQLKTVRADMTAPRGGPRDVSLSLFRRDLHPTPWPGTQQADTPDCPSFSSSAAQIWCLLPTWGCPSLSLPVPCPLSLLSCLWSGPLPCPINFSLYFFCTSHTISSLNVRTVVFYLVTQSFAWSWCSTNMYCLI